MYFTDPQKCSRCQNNGWDDYLVNGECHRCNMREVMHACITANVRRGNIALAIFQLRLVGR